MDIYQALLSMNPEKIFRESFPESLSRIRVADRMTVQQHAEQYHSELPKDRIVLDLDYLTPSMEGLVAREAEEMRRVFGIEDCTYETVHLTWPNLEVYAKDRGTAIIMVGVPKESGLFSMKLKDEKEIKVRFGQYEKHNAGLYEFMSEQRTPSGLSVFVLQLLLHDAKRLKKPVIAGGVFKKYDNEGNVLIADLFNVGGRVFAYLTDVAQEARVIQPRVYGER